MNEVYDQFKSFYILTVVVLLHLPTWVCDMSLAVDSVTSFFKAKVNAIVF
jgi:hypothetical protein